MVRKYRRTHFMRNISKTLGLPATSRKILESLARTRKYLPVKELVKRVKMSERSVRKHLMLLKGRGLLMRRAVSKGPRKIAYEYALRPASEILSATRKEFTLSMRKLERIVDRLGKKDVESVSPRTV